MDDSIDVLEEFNQLDKEIDSNASQQQLLGLKESLFADLAKYENEDAVNSKSPSSALRESSLSRVLAYKCHLCPYFCVKRKTMGSHQHRFHGSYKTQNCIRIYKRE